MKKLLLFIAAAVFAASAAFAQYPVPDIEPVPDGITIAVHIPDGTDCYGAPLWGGDTNPSPWSGEEMVAVEGAEGWYKVDINATSAQGKVLANFENWESGLGNWDTQWGMFQILEGTTASYVQPYDLVIESSGIMYVWVEYWQDNPCEPDREYTFTVVVPECTPAGQETVNVVGSFPDADGDEWAKGIEFPIVDGKATITINGKETDKWKVRLTDDWSQQAVECRDGQIDVWNSQTLGEAEGQVIVVEGWGKEGSAIGDCLSFSDCKPLILSTNNFILYPGEFAEVSLEYKDSPVDATAAVWISNDPEVFTIDETGLITGVATGQGTFTVTYNDLSATGYVKVLDEALLDITVPDIEPVPDGITVAVYIPDGTDCYGAPLWGGDTNNWGGEEMQAVDGYPGWYKLDVPGVSSLQGKPLAHPEGWTPEQGLGDWPTQIGDWEILQGSDICTRPWDNFEISAPGYVAIWAKNWQINPCDPDREYTFTVVVPECTPAGQKTVNVVGSFPDADGDEWAKGIDFPIVDGKATITIYGKETYRWKVRLTDDWSQQAVECRDGQIDVWNSQTLGAAEGQEIYVEGWGDTDAPLEGCGCEEEPTAIDEEETVSESLAVTAKDGRVYCEEEFRIVNLAGQDVTAMNGELQGTYIVVSGDKAVKVSVE